MTALIEVDKTYEAKGVFVLSVTRGLEHSALSLFGDEIKAIIKENEAELNGVVLDLKATELLNSNAIAMIVMTLKTLKIMGASLVLINVSKSSFDVLEITHLNELISKADSLADAIEICLS